MKKISILIGRQVHFWLKPIIYLLINNSNRTRVLLNYKDQVLLVKGYISDNTWSFPGGGVRKNESIEEGLIREIEEETKINLEKEQLIFVSKLQIKYLIFKQNIYLYKVELTKKPPITLRKYEISDSIWFNQKELKEYKFNKYNRLYLKQFVPLFK